MSRKSVKLRQLVHQDRTNKLYHILRISGTLKREAGLLHNLYFSANDLIARDELHRKEFLLLLFSNNIYHILLSK